MAKETDPVRLNVNCALTVEIDRVTFLEYIESAADEYPEMSERKHAEMALELVGEQLDGVEVDDPYNFGRIWVAGTDKVSVIEGFTMPKAKALKRKGRVVA